MAGAARRARRHAKGCSSRRPQSSPPAEYRRAARHALRQTYEASAASIEPRRRHRIGSCHVLPCDNAQQHVQLVELASAITADLAVDEDGALLHRAAGYHRRVARLLAGRADRAERLDHQVLAKRPRAGRRVRGAARVGRSGSGPREWTSADPSELAATESDEGLRRYRGRGAKEADESDPPALHHGRTSLRLTGELGPTCACWMNAGGVAPLTQRDHPTSSGLLQAAPGSQNSIFYCGAKHSANRSLSCLGVARNTSPSAPPLYSTKAGTDATPSASATGLCSAASRVAKAISA